MAPLPTIAHTYRCTLNWRKTAVASVHNVIHVRSTSSSFADVRDFFGDPDNFEDNMFLTVSESYALTSVTVQPLDGATASLEQLLSSEINGGATGQPILELASVVSFHSLHSGASGRGRIFMGPTTEGIWDGASLQYSLPDTVTAWETFAGNLLTGLIDGEHVVASYTDAAAYPVEQYVAHTYGATQRGRLLANRLV